MGSSPGTSRSKRAHFLRAALPCFALTVLGSAPVTAQSLTPDLFSPNRVMAASNWPVILLGASYQETWQGITDLVSGLSADEQRAVMGDTAVRIYGL